MVICYQILWRTRTHTHIYIYGQLPIIDDNALRSCLQRNLFSFAPEDSVSPIVFYISVCVCELCTFAHVYMYECMLYMYIVRYAVDTIGNKVPVAAARVTIPVTRSKTHTWL